MSNADTSHDTVNPATNPAASPAANPAAKRIVVLISGSGTNLQALIDSANREQFNGEIVAVISNRPDVMGLKRAALADIPALTLDHKEFGSREQFDKALITLIDQWKPDLIVLAGFMRILTVEMVAHYQGKMLNIHPSLLPAYPGLNTHQRVLEAGDPMHGSTVHFVTAELDGGPLIIQARVATQKNDTSDSLQQRVLQQEHTIYPLAVKWFCQNRLVLRNQTVYFDSNRLNTPFFIGDGEVQLPEEK